VIAVFKNTWKVLDNNEKREFRLLVILDALVSIVDIFSLALLLWIIQFYVQPASNSKLSFLPAWLADRNSIAFIAIFFVLFGLKNVAAYLISKSQYHFFGRVAIRLSRNNLSRYQRSGYPEFVSIDSSDHIRRIALQPFEFCQYMLTGVQQIITQSILILLGALAILVFNAKLFLLLLLILLPPVVIVFYQLKKKMAKTKRMIQSDNQRSYQYLLDALKGYVESNVYERHDFFMTRFLRAREKFSAAVFESLSLQNMPSRIIEVFAILGLFILIAIVKWSGNNDGSTFITIGAFMGATYKIIPGLVKIINAGGQMKAYGLSAIDLVDNDYTNQETTSGEYNKEIRSVQFEKVRFQFSGQPLINNLCFYIQRGDFVGIQGDSGKGKTTILNLLLGFLPADDGRILVDGQPLHSDDLKTYWHHIAYVRQQPFFIYDTILRNITLTEEGHNEENLLYALKVSGLSELVSTFPEGVNKIITENGKNISGGQQQRIAIARALYKNAGLIILDEPFNELDEASTISMLRYFQKMASGGKIVLLISHDRKSLSFCNKTISLDD
jgi:ABC-type multidrug transport system fused ATPase/permease subunit